MLKKTFWKIYSFYYWKIVNYLSEHELFGLYYAKQIKRTKRKMKNVEFLGSCPYCCRLIEKTKED